MTEEERIQSIKKNGGCHLQNFKKENITYDMCLAAVMDDGEAIEYVPDDYKTRDGSYSCKRFLYHGSIYS